MELDEVMRTTPATREFTDEPVTPEDLYTVLERARFAPSGGNRQGRTKDEDGARLPSSFVVRLSSGCKTTFSNSF